MSTGAWHPVAAGAPVETRRAYRHIYVAIDNSEWSNRAIHVAVEIGRAFRAKLTGCHVYAAGLHDYRFKQMEYTLPGEYRDERELERQREIHGSLISMGLRLISESYLDAMERNVKAAGLAFERKLMDGRHYKALIEDARTSDYDLVVMGALGMGAVSESQLGSVTERVVRKVTTDTLIVRDNDGAPNRPVIVCLDGSPRSLAGLQRGLALATALGRPLTAVAVIDTGLAEIHQSHLEIGRKLAAQEGIGLSTTLLTGKCFQQILTCARQERPWLLIMGSAGAHSDEAEVDLGSNTRNVMRLARCNLLVAGRRP